MEKCRLCTDVGFHSSPGPARPLGERDVSAEYLLPEEDEGRSLSG